MTEPAVSVHAAHSSSGPNLPINRVVIHTTSPPAMPGVTSSRAGQAHATALYFTEPAAGGSAHYVVDVASEEHCLPDSVVAWHAPPNPGSIGIEICGEPTYTRDVWLSADVWPAVVRAASRTRDLCARYSIPVVRLSVADLKAGHRGLCGHIDVTNAFHESDHTDPGPNFPWPEFLAAVGAAPAPPAAPAPAPVPAPVPAPEPEEGPMAMVVIDTKATPDQGRIPNWEVNQNGDIFNWNGARQLRSLSTFPGVHPPIVAVAAAEGGDGVVLFANDTRRDENGHWVRSTYEITVGM